MVEKTTSAEDVNKKLKAAAEGPLKGILGYTEEPLVSSESSTWLKMQPKAYSPKCSPAWSGAAGRPETLDPR